MITMNYETATRSELIAMCQYLDGQILTSEDDAQRCADGEERKRALLRRVTVHLAYIVNEHGDISYDEALDLLLDINHELTLGDM